MTRLAGIDGCRAGWFAVAHNRATGSFHCAVYRSIEHAMGELEDCRVIAIGIPIGLPDAGPRACDVLARKFLQPTRGASVFPAPIRPVLAAATHNEASSIRYGIEGKRVSLQAFNITAKIAEVDRFLRSRPDHATRVVEVHPEVSFAAMANGRAMPHRKSLAQGRDERLGLLARHFPRQSIMAALQEFPRSAVAKDDILDAFAALWSAQSIADGRAQRFPDAAEHDRHEIDMAIWY